MPGVVKAMPYIDGRADDEREDTACWVGGERMVEVDCYAGDEPEGQRAA